MKDKTKYGLGWVETSTSPTVGDQKVTEPIIHLYSIENQQVMTFDNRTKAQGVLDFLRERFKDRLDPKIEVIELSLFTE